MFRETETEYRLEVYGYKNEHYWVPVSHLEELKKILKIKTADAKFKLSDLLEFYKVLNSPELSFRVCKMCTTYTYANRVDATDTQG